MTELIEMLEKEFPNVKIVRTVNVMECMLNLHFYSAKLKCPFSYTVTLYDTENYTKDMFDSIVLALMINGFEIK